MQNFIKIHENDNVIVALQTIPKGSTLTFEDGTSVTSNTEIPSGHKMAINSIAEGNEELGSGCTAS